VTTLVSIGNTNTRCAMLLKTGRPGPVTTIPTAQLKPGDVSGAPGPIHMISVVGARGRALAAALRRAGRRVVVWGVDRAVPVRHPYSPPASPGVDRLVAALRAHRIAGGACVVVDAGTAVTVDVVRADGAIEGGAIGPGFSTIARGLKSAAPGLPLADPAARVRYPARSTQAAVDVGVFHAFSGMVRGLVDLASKDRGLPVLVTGGEASLAAKALRPGRVTVRPTLLLEGLAALAAESP
jgi:type III pantothenate kinase